MSSSTPVTVVLVPGMCSTAQVWDPLIQALKSGHNITSVKSIALPSQQSYANGSVDVSPNPLEADIKAIRAVLKDAIEKQHEDVLLVAHSYGGTPALNSTQGLWKHAGGSNGVTKALLISSSLCLPGQAVGMIRQQYVQEHPDCGIDDMQGVSLEEKNGQHYVVPNPDLWPIWLSDFPASDQLKFGKANVVPSALGGPLTPVPESGEHSGDPKDWRIEYLLCEDIDKAMPNAFQEYLIDQARQAGARVEVTRIRSGHFVQVTHAEEVAEWIAKNANGA